jgi:hypothetical protein
VIELRSTLNALLSSRGVQGFARNSSSQSSKQASKEESCRLPQCLSMEPHCTTASRSLILQKAKTRPFSSSHMQPACPHTLITELLHQRPPPPHQRLQAFGFSLKEVTAASTPASPLIDTVQRSAVQYSTSTLSHTISKTSHASSSHNFEPALLSPSPLPPIHHSSSNISLVTRADLCAHCLLSYWPYSNPHPALCL